MKATKRILHLWVEHWRHLRAWGRSLEEISVTVKGVAGHAEPGCGGDYSTGVARPVRRTAIIRAGADLPDALATVLHEYAHLAAPAGAGHGPAWSSRFADAVREVTGVAIVPEGARAEIDRAATAALRAWWRVSGNSFAAKLLLG
jgi:hypothetical protein